MMQNKMNYFPFSIEQLNLLRTIKNEKNLKNTAKKLYISQPALSLQVQNLESKIASPILERNNKQIHFTIIGHLLVKHATKILQLYKEANESIKLIRVLKKISLIIGSNESIGIYLLPKIIRLFCKYYSYTCITVELEATHCISWNVFHGKVDIGIVAEEEIPYELLNTLDIIPYINEEIVLILPKTYPLKNPNILALEDLYKLDFIGLNPDFMERKVLNKTLQKYNIKIEQLKIKFELNSIEAIIRAVNAGLGVSFVSILAVKDELLSKRINSVMIDGIRINKRLSIIINNKVYKSLLFKKFYYYCFFLLKRDFTY
uniref:lysR transcriptional regulator n=1 Tax=Silvetia siliquosa TaxID=93837 RepID=UPI001FA6B37F|nr:lysR transcriptional regulator [Silvetia siliquosa]UNH90212.1 lysR transcriptional regulator [Silvetia siliquosa]